MFCLAKRTYYTAKLMSYTKYFPVSVKDGWQFYLDTSNRCAIKSDSLLGYSLSIDISKIKTVRSLEKDASKLYLPSFIILVEDE